MAPVRAVLLVDDVHWADEDTMSVLKLPGGLLGTAAACADHDGSGRTTAARLAGTSQHPCDSALAVEPAYAT